MAEETKQTDKGTFIKGFEIPEEVMDNLLFRFIHNLSDHEVSEFYKHLGGNMMEEMTFRRATAWHS
jgi:hypothetical protein